MSSDILQIEYFNGITTSDLIKNSLEGHRVDAIHQFRSVKSFSFIRSVLNSNMGAIPIRIVFDMRISPNDEEKRWTVVLTRDLSSPIYRIVAGSPLNIGYTYGYGYESKSSYVYPRYRELGLMTLMIVVMMKVMDIHYDQGCELIGYLPEYTASLQGSCWMAHALHTAAVKMGRKLYYKDRKIEKTDILPETFQRGEYVIR